MKNDSLGIFNFLEESVKEAKEKSEEAKNVEEVVGIRILFAQKISRIINGDLTR
jgi:hypothetical protein